MVRLYAAPIDGLECIADHTWFAVKAADRTTFDRWEVLVFAAEPYGYVHKNAQSPTGDCGAGGVYVLAERIGPDAEPVVEFIERESPDYPARECYFLISGPNSSTYTQWVLDNTDWQVDLPATVIGEEAAPVCP